MNDKTQFSKLIDNLNLIKPREKYGLKYQNISLLGLVCIYPICYRYNSLVISINELIVFIPIISFIISITFFNFFKKHLGFIWSLFHNLTIGVLFLYTLIFINSVNKQDNIEFKSYKIKKVRLVDNHKKGDQTLHPIITLKIDSIVKNINIHHQHTKNSLHSDSIRLGIIKGNLGYAEIISFEFIKK